MVMSLVISNAHGACCWLLCQTCFTIFLILRSKDPPTPWKDILHDSNKDTVNTGVWHNTKGTPISDGISLYVPIKTATLFEHYTHCEEQSDEAISYF